MTRTFVSTFAALTLLVTSCAGTAPAHTTSPATHIVLSANNEVPQPASSHIALPTRTAGPAPFPSDLTWFAPNMGSVDYIELFTKPENWIVAREKIDIFKFYTQNLLIDPCSICGNNTLNSFVQSDAFEKLSDWGIAIGVEVGAVKPWGCTSDITFEVVTRVVNNVEANGGTVAILAMDEPRVGGEENTGGLTCGYGMEQSAAQTAAFIKQVRAAYPDIVVGDIQAYPHFSVTEHKDWILALKAAGATPDFFHMDIDIERVRTEGANVTADLQELESFCQEHGIPFGVIMISNWREAYSNRAYYDSTMGWIETVNNAIGKPQHVVFQSWQGPAPSGDHEVPINLPQNDPENYSHVRLINTGLAVFGIE